MRDVRGLLRALEDYRPGEQCHCVPMVQTSCGWLVDEHGRWRRRTAIREFARRAVLGALRWAVREDQ